VPHSIYVFRNILTMGSLAGRLGTSTVRIDLSADSWLHHEPAFLSPDEAERVFAQLRVELGWEQREIVLFGRRIPQPRLIAWGGTPAYRYSGQTLEPRGLTATVAELLARVNAFTHAPFNHVLANRYRDGHDSMGMHADDERELGPAPVVATLSLGATRRLVIAPRRAQAGARRSLALDTGSLLVMAGACQSEFRHGLPRDPAVQTERISLTFRAVANREG
jgi:alkylated DNA repair dioxygenase AlkB